MSALITSYKPNKLALFTAMTAAMVITSGCQSLKTANATNQPTTTVQGQNADQPKKLESFNITGKIGVTTPANDSTGTQGGSAFYAWGQQNDRFAIELIGALGIGKTNIEYNGQTATLVSEKTGTLTADDPETLLKKATGWQAPISQMPYWISGRPAPSDSAPQLDDQSRLVSSVNGEWTANFTYKGTDKLPSKISAVQPQGNKVVMTINH
ncbi:MULTISPECIES: lipoprotein insertase outer membrane protein LolB [unclassified Psychrobacter]|uniref:lipoprotein insertase outer membrane protein LolB n=1 Tax=unclassified Psychrobacter TaxID=196806 RepID=UPI00086A73D6|nr:MULTISPECIES: lipoprotein insertase outer membrane protein LolB [unclassified Psychrobacter]OEH68048.1 MAG: outer membrane lipoprotein LolB [Psychrobacter sp. B29-1]PKG64489.1 outer membrane lipoprotein LolB [Psychrobacter sp. Choline-02u-13]PKH48682.1 outer membrane lipoprotein LolB [Psychrobacter sp. Choline-02u-9]|tara:strand:- start:62 stop:694 length:633 start_codon:yes stop_codon:yes gene_type:complete